MQVKICKRKIRRRVELINYTVIVNAFVFLFPSSGPPETIITNGVLVVSVVFHHLSCPVATLVSLDSRS